MIKNEDIIQLKNIVFQLTSISHHKRKPNWKTKRRIVHQPTLVFITEGSGTFTINERTYPIEAGRVFALKKNDIIQAALDANALAQFYILAFSFHPLIELKKEKVEWQLPIDGELLVNNFSTMITLVEKIFIKKASFEPLVDWHKQILFQELLYTIVVEMKKQQENGNISFTIEQILNYMNENYMEDFTISDISKTFGLSPTNFSRVFKNHVGLNPVEYLTKLRIKKAKNLLTFNFRLKEVAKTVGYNDELYFSRIFKKTVGVSPTIYVKNNYKKIVTLNANLNDYFVTLEAPPVATLFYEGKSQVNGYLPYLADELDNTKIIGRNNQPNYEAILKVAPDLILNDDCLFKNASLLQKIAPIIVTNLDDNWKGLLLEISRLIDKKERARNWLLQFDEKAEAAKKKLAKVISSTETVMVLILTKKGFRIYGGRRQLGAILYKELGLTPPKGISLNTHFIYTTLEQLKFLNPDHIFLSTWAMDSCEEEMSFFKKSDVWASLTAVKKCQVYEMDHWINAHAPLKNSITIDKTLEYMIKN